MPSSEFFFVLSLFAYMNLVFFSFVDRDTFTVIERELTGVKALLNQREDELVQLCVAKEASDATADALRGELEVAADNAILHAQAVEKKYVEERLE
jgi:hypothetical protein